jgi:hypothetical protein
VPRAQKSHPRVGRPEPGSAIAPVAWCKLGYPLYMTTILGARKVLSILGLAVPRFPRLKEFGLCRSHFRLFWRDVSSSTVGDGLDNVAASGRCRPVILLWCRSSASRSSQNGFSVNLTAVLDDQAQHIGYIIKEAMNRGFRCSQPSKEAEEEWVAEIKRLAVMTTDFLSNCTPGYYNNEGHLQAEAGLIPGAYAPGINAFNALNAKWREKGDLEGLELS